MVDESTLFTDESGKPHRGRLRRGLDVEVRAARDAGRELPESLVAGLRIVADNADRLDRVNRESRKPYDAMPLLAAHREYREAHAAVFGSAHDVDPFDRLVAEIAASEASHPTGP
jgi:hypothetical protein